MSEEKATKDKSSNSLTMDALVKKFGAGVFQSGQDLVEDERKIIPISPNLDTITGGIPQGSVVRMTGQQKCGKTVTSLCIARNAQLADPRTKVVFLNIENRLKKRDVQGIKGLNYWDEDRFALIGSYRDEKKEEGKILSAEEYLEIGEWYIHNVPYCVLIVDSISMLVTGGELTSDINQAHRAPGAMLMSRWLKRNSAAVAVNKVILIGITHLIANTGAKPGQKTRTESGGNKIKYATDVGLECLYHRPWSTKKDGPQVGQQLQWKTSSTATDVPPMRECESYIRYGIGIDETYELFQVGKMCGFITGSSWMTLSYMSNYLDVLGVEEWNDEVEKSLKRQGQEKLLALLEENPEYLDCLKKEINKMMGIEE